MNAAPYWASVNGDVTLHLGDCLDVLRTMEADSIDAIVTDPPAGIAFMGRDWDDFCRARSRFVDMLTERMAEAWRVLKPGGHALVWSIPRTSHWTAWAVEDAGFDLRDCVLHLFGSGFPKSLDVSKAIDRARDDKAEVMAVAAWLRDRIEASGVTRKAIAEHFGINPRGVDLWAPNPTDNSARQRVHTPTWEQWEQLRDMLNLDPEMDAEVWRLNGRKGTPGEAWSQREVIGSGAAGLSAGTIAAFKGSSMTFDITAPATEDAARWEGWGTALKPGQEMWWLARKPLKGTVAGNVLERGTGAINVAACMVEGPAGDGTGRWPTNIVFTHSAACDDQCAPDCPLAELDRQSGVLRNGGQNATSTNPNRGSFSKSQGGGFSHSEPTSYAGDTGGASRFYPAFRYQAKAPASERPRLDDGTAHETVKPLGLMTWLVRLITPSGGTVLDLFAGSGPVAEACIIEGFRCVIIEQDPKSADLIRKRLGKPIQPVMFGL